MIYNQYGQMFFYEDKLFMVGEEVYSIENGLYGLLGRISEIRTGDDRETENEGPDIYCTFRKPVLMKDKPWICNLPLASDDITFDLVIMAPEMLIPTRLTNTTLPKMKVYVLIESSVVDGTKSRSIKLYADKIHAEICMRKAIEQEKEDGCLAEWIGTKLYVEESLEENSFRAYLKNEYCFNHFNIYVSEVELSLSVPFIKEMLPTCLGMKYREDIAEQIDPWDIPKAVKRTAINDPSIYMRVQIALDGKNLCNEEYYEAISEVAHSLTKEHAKIESILDKARKDGKL